MKKFLFYATITVALVACNKPEFTINAVFEPTLQVPDSTHIGIDIKVGDSTITHYGFVNNNVLSISFDIPEEQLAVLDLGELGETAVAIEKGKVNIHVGLNEDGKPVIRKEGSLNNDFIQMYDDYDGELYSAYTMQDEQAREQAFNDCLNKIYRTLKGEENSLTSINTMSGQYGFMNFFYLLEFDQVDTLCSLMNDKTLENKNMRSIYDHVQLQKESGAGKTYKDISAKTPDDKTLSLSDLVGESDYVLVDFWASWCGPCRRAMPAMKDLYEASNGRLEILGVSLDSDESKWKNAITSLGLPWKHISDLKGWQAQGAQDYGVNAIPCTILINKEGIIVGRNMEIQTILDILKE